MVYDICTKLLFLHPKNLLFLHPTKSTDKWLLNIFEKVNATSINTTRGHNDKVWVYYDLNIFAQRYWQEQVRCWLCIFIHNAVMVCTLQEAIKSISPCIIKMEASKQGREEADKNKMEGKVDLQFPKLKARVYPKKMYKSIFNNGCLKHHKLIRNLLLQYIHNSYTGILRIVWYLL